MTTPGARCDRIIELIDECLGQTARSAEPVDPPSGEDRVLQEDIRSS